MERILIAVIILLSYSSIAQSNKKVLGTVTMGCRVYNYEFNQMSNGICSFVINDVDNEKSPLSFNKDTIKTLRSNLNFLVNSLDSIHSLSEIQIADSNYNKENIVNLVREYQNILDKLEQDSADWNYWIENNSSIQKLLARALSSGLLKYDSTLIYFQYKPLLEGFNNKIKSILISANETVEPRTYSFNEFKEDAFVTLCSYILSQKTIFNIPECSNIIDINKISRNIFYEIKTRLEFIDDEPITSYIKLKDLNINCFYSKKANIRNSKSDNILIKDKFVVENVSIEFEDGTIKNLLADLSVSIDFGDQTMKVPLHFKNNIPISISSRNDLDRLSQYNIYVSDFGAIKGKIFLDVEPNQPIKFMYETDISVLNEDPVEKRNKTDYYNIYFKLSDLIDYIDVLEVNKEDYSPVNSVINLNRFNCNQELRKEKRSRLLTVKAFSDLVGIQGDQPNGLIQIEASRKFNLSTKYIGLKNFHYSILSYIEPKLVFNKIDQNNNRLVIKQSSNYFVDDIKELDLIRYQNSSFDLNLNVMKMDLPGLKSNFQYHINAGFLRTNILDTLSYDLVAIGSLDSKIYNKIINTFNFGLSAQFDLKPDSRYGVSLGYDMRALRLLSDVYFLTLETDNIIHSFWVNAFIKTNSENELFFKYKFSYSRPAFEQNYIQIQVGYMIDIFKPIKK